jgi:tetratricopeptide (TPR) repeat protein
MYGKKKTGDTGAATTTQPQATPDTSTAAPDDMTNEERLALEAQQRADAERLAQDAQRAEEAQKQAFAQGILKRGMDLAKQGEYVPSISTFLDFIRQGGYTRGTREHYTAWFGIANALANAGVYQAAANYLLDVLLVGPEGDFFQQAFWQLRKIRQKINYSPPNLEELTKFPVVNFSRPFQDEYNYVLGEFFYDYSNYTRALTYFEQVSDDSADYAKAVYLMGLIQVQNQLYRSAVQSFQNAITATEKNSSDPEVADLAYLALARIAYEANEQDAAIYYYRKVPKNSNKVATAFYESAWTYFAKGDHSRALGTFQVLHSPFFSHYFYPELWILEAETYYSLCKYKEAREAIEMFKKSVSALAIPLKHLLNRLRVPQDYYKAFFGIAENEKGYNIDKRLIYPVFADVVFYNLYKTIKKIEWEEAQINAVKDQLGQFGADLSAKLAQLRQKRLIEAGIRVNQVLKTVQGEIAEYTVKVTEMELDLEEMEMEAKDREIQGLGVEEVTVEGTEEAEGVRVIVGSDSMSWEFEGEYWKDAIGGFRSFIKSACVAE